MACHTSYQPGHVHDLLPWMQRCTEKHKTLMDLADASLLWLAGQLDTPTLLTEDRRDFLRYRMPDGRAFEVLA